MMSDLAPEQKEKAVWRAFKSIKDVVRKQRIRAHLLDSTMHPALAYAPEIWSLRKQGEESPSVIEGAVERAMLGVSRFTKVRDGIRSSDLHQRSKIKDTVLYAKQSKIRWAGHVMRMNETRCISAVCDWIPRDVKHTARKPPTRWSEFIAKSLKKGVMFDEFLEQAEPTGLFLHATGKNRRFTGARSATRPLQMIQVILL
uniref:Reverse transcriptase domain-containing protein n=1 Tax=Angiostrongylus cantonensis TaxID=6313 RepID=A0A0K0DLZ8_ANGCA